MFEFAHAWQRDRSEDRPDTFNVRVRVPDRLRERFHQNLAHRVGGRRPMVSSNPATRKPAALLVTDGSSYSTRPSG